MHLSWNRRSAILSSQRIARIGSLPGLATSEITKTRAPAVTGFSRSFCGLGRFVWQYRYRDFAARGLADSFGESKRHAATSAEHKREVRF